MTNDQAAPAVVSTLIERGISLHRVGKLDGAEIQYLSVLKSDKRNFRALELLGVLNYQRGDLGTALRLLNKALSVNRSTPRAYLNRGVVLAALTRQREAIRDFERAILLLPEYAEAYNFRGNALCEIGRFDDACASIKRAISLNPNSASAYQNLGVSLNCLGLQKDATAAFDKSLELDPEFVPAQLSKGMTELLTGNFEKGWNLYEARWKSPGVLTRNLSHPLWLGDQSIAGRIVLLHAEQGFGDTIQFCRYASKVNDFGATVIMEVQRPLVRLMKSLDGVTMVVGQGEDLPQFDYHAPLLSLPLAFKTTLDTVPSNIPYLRVPPDVVRAWSGRVPHGDGSLRIGLCWAGSSRPDVASAYWIDKRRSIPQSDLSVFADLPNMIFVSLQKGEERESHMMKRSLKMLNFSKEIGDFLDTAGIIRNLDLVISVDTAVAHLAGALGTPVWLLNRYDTCWRWLLHRNDSPWYPTLRQFRQPRPGDWTTVLAEVRRALMQFSADFPPAQ